MVTRVNRNDLIQDHVNQYRDNEDRYHRQDDFDSHGNINNNRISNKLLNENRQDNKVCIYGFTFHNWFCICDLVNINKNADYINEDKSLVCDKCLSKFRSEYKVYLSFLSDPPRNVHIFNGEFLDFKGYLDLYVQQKMTCINNTPLDSYECRLSEKQKEQAKTLFTKIYNRYIESFGYYLVRTW